MSHSFRQVLSIVSWKRHSFRAKEIRTTKPAMTEPETTELQHMSELQQEQLDHRPKGKLATFQDALILKLPSQLYSPVLISREVVVCPRPVYTS